jgi:NAD(P)-dependent dehydrogenase (short-subunit alcohol dehydrogenase family)
MKKIVIITGASGGIGGSIAKRLAKDGFAVVVNYAGKAASAQSLVADIKAAGGQGIAVQADVAIAADVERLFKESMEAFGVPGAFTGGTNHFAYAGSPADKARVAEYEAGPYKGFADDVLKGFSSIVPPDANVEGVAEAIVKVVDAPFGKRPFRVHYDPTQDGAEVVNMVLDRVRAELLRRIGLTDVLTPRDLTGQSKSAA